MKNKNKRIIPIIAGVVFIVGILRFAFISDRITNSHVVLWFLLAVLIYLAFEIYYLKRGESISGSSKKIDNFSEFMLDNVIILILSLISSMVVTGFLDFCLNLWKIIKYLIKGFLSLLSSLPGAFIKLAEAVTRHKGVFIFITIVGVVLLSKYIIYRILIQGGRK